jgi:glycine cleavage system pyridoxal-binding protein P
MKFFAADTCFPQTLDVLRARAEPLGIELIIGDWREAKFDASIFGALVQSPDEAGMLHDLRPFIAKAKQAGVMVAVATDLLSLTLLTPPGELGADVVLGNSQRFGVPLGYGGPHAAFFATLEKHVRQVPGRIIGVSVDVHGNSAYRMALQTREQHIRREKATSNICTAQALNALGGVVYLSWLGRHGIGELGELIAARTHYARETLAALPGVQKLHAQPVVREFALRLDADVAAVRERCIGAGVNPGADLHALTGREEDRGGLLVAITERRSRADIDRLARLLGEAVAGAPAGVPAHPEAVPA